MLAMVCMVLQRPMINKRLASWYNIYRDCPCLLANDTVIGHPGQYQYYSRVVSDYIPLHFHLHLFTFVIKIRIRRIEIKKDYHRIKFYPIIWRKKNILVSSDYLVCGISFHKHVTWPQWPDLCLTPVYIFIQANQCQYLVLIMAALWDYINTNCTKLLSSAMSIAHSTLCLRPSHIQLKQSAINGLRMLHIIMVISVTLCETCFGNTQIVECPASWKHS